ncbi:MAG: SDR family oxidoreductase [Pseudomonadota bacterium]
MPTTLIAGASRGIGLELARQAAARGDSVIACARDPEAPGLADLPEGVERRRLDVTDPENCAGLAAALEGREIDLLVCNAGVFLSRGRLDEAAFAPEDWARSFAVNVTGVFQTIRALRPRMRRPGGRIAVISSIMGSSERAQGGSYIYRASKAATTNLARNLAVDLKLEGLAVGAYHPGWVRTDMGGASATVSPQDSAAGLLARFEALTPETTGAFESYDGTPLPF